MLRGARWIFGVLLGLELLYVVAANLFLNCNGLSLAFAGTNQVNVKISGGWTLIPGRVHVRNVRVVFHDKNLQFSIDIAQASLGLHLTELAHHTFHASHLRGQGLAFHLRHRVDPWSRNEPAVGTFAPFPEFPGPAVFEATVPEAPLSDALYNLWTIHLDDVDVGVSEIWAQAFRYRGNGRARGAFQLKPARELWVGPASLELRPGTLSAGAYRVAPGMHGRIDCTVHRFDVRAPRGMQAFRYISARVWLTSPALDPQVYALFGSEPAPRLASAGGSLDLNVTLRHGILGPPSAIQIVQHNFEMRAAAGDLLAERLEVRAGLDGDARSQASLSLEHGTLKEPIAPGYAPVIDHVSLGVVSENRDVARDFTLAEVRLEELRLTLVDSSWLNRWVKGRNFALLGGAVSLIAKGRYKDKQVAGEAWLASEGVDAIVGTKRTHYAGALGLRGTEIDPQAFTGRVSAELTGRSLFAELGQGNRLDLAGVRVRVSAERDRRGNRAQGQAELFSLSTTAAGLALRAPRIVAFAHSEQIDNGAQVTRFNAEIPELSAEGRGGRFTSAAQGRGTFIQPKNKSGKRLEFWASLQEPRALFGTNPVTAAALERVQMHAALTSDADSSLSGSLELAPASWRVDAGNMRFSGKSALDLELSELNLSQNRGNVRARLSSSGVTLGDTRQNADCPWSRAQTLVLDGTARLLERGGAALSLNGNFRQTELNWGDFLTHADIDLKSSFDPGLIGGDGTGQLELDFRNATLQSGGGARKGWEASVPALDLHANLARQAGKLSGAATLTAEAAHGRIGATRLTTDLSANFELDTLDLSARSAHGSGGVHLRNVALPNVPDPISKWWADVKLDSIFGRAAQNLELGGMFRANLRDATPGLAVLAAQGALPKWVASTFPLRDLSVTGSLARRCRLTDIHLVQLRGGPAVARGRLQSLPDGFQGAMLMRVSGLSLLSAGLEFDENHTDFGLFRGDGWLLGLERNFDRKSDDATQLVCPPDPDRCTEPAALSLAREP